MTIDIKKEFDYLVQSGNAIVPKYVELSSFLPKPTIKDYDRGWIERYFAKRVNDKDSSIVEISKNLYQLLRGVTYYSIMEMRWVIRGPIDIVTKSNKQILDIKEEQFSGISLRLPSLTQFRRE